MFSTHEFHNLYDILWFRYSISSSCILPHTNMRNWSHVVPQYSICVRHKILIVWIGIWDLSSQDVFTLVICYKWLCVSEYGKWLPKCVQSCFSDTSHIYSIIFSSWVNKVSSQRKLVWCSLYNGIKLDFMYCSVLQYFSSMYGKIIT